MNTFVFHRNQKLFLGGMMLIGALALLITYLGDDALHMRFWSNVLHNSAFFTGIAFMGLFFLAACITAYAGWHTVFKRIWEAYSQFLVVGLILMLIIAGGLWLGYHHLYHWADPESTATDDLLQHKSPFLNRQWFTLGTIIIMGIWIFFASRLRSLSLREDKETNGAYSLYRRSKIWAAAYLPVAGFSCVALIWLWIMSMEPHWYSTLFAWYNMASWFVSMICLTILVLLYLQGRGYYPGFNRDHLHDLGKYLFAFSIFWTYLWFSQYMLIWYGNVGEETVYFQTRMNDYPVLFYGNLLINFVLPFLVLMRNDTKRKNGTMIFTASVVFIGHWIDYFLMIKPGALHTTHELAGEAHGAEAAAEHASTFVMGYTIPGLLEIFTFIGFLGLFLFFVFNRLEKASLVPRKDPYLGESLHHHV